MSIRLLIIEDDPQLNQMLIFHFEDVGYQPEGVLTCKEAMQRLHQTAFDLVLLDQQLPDGRGIDLLTQIKKHNPDQPVVMITGQHDLELAIEAIKQGAADFIHKPLKIDALEQVIASILETRRLSQEVTAQQPGSPESTQPRSLIGRGEAMLQVSKEIALSAESAVNVLITGESGTGKEIVARLIHLHSNCTGAFVAVNCAAIVDTLLESELFGHEKGAFTGAVQRKLGKFELAKDGTLFLDEMGELALPLQAKILRALQERTFDRVGGNQPVSTNARVITATNRDLLQSIKSGDFREDLLYRLNVISIELPPLRERKEDIKLLAEALMQKISRSLHKPALHLTAPALSKLHDYHWPGNVRELENVLTQAMVHARNSALTPDLISLGETSAPQANHPAENETNVLRTLDSVEAEHIQAVLSHTRGHKSQSCKILDISRPALDRKIKKYNLTVGE